MNYEQLDYSALDDKTISRKDFSKEQLAAAGVKNQMMPIVLPMVAFIVGMVVYGTALTSDFLLLIISVPVLIGMLIVVISLGKRQLRVLKFALDNQAYFSAAKTTPPSQPIMFNIGHRRIQTNTFVFHDGASLAKYQYTTGSGKNQQTHFFNYMQITLPRQVPHLFINGKKNAVNPNTFEYKVEKLKLEGDFSKHFDLLVPPGYQRDALQILTPDVMAALIDFGKEYDFELIGSELYIYQSGMFSKELFTSAEKLRTFLTAVDKISSQFGKQTKTYSDLRAGNVSSNLVATEGAKFKKRSLTWLYAAIIVIVLCYMILSFIYLV
ncbi:hypothetical protein FWD20_02870 [Candidatus Saccharibacteria bacterium]|nr:hypothetical protein [Candidatus Saccharibacteria bacterium]